MKSTIVVIMIIFVSAIIGRELAYHILQAFPISLMDSLLVSGMASTALAIWLYVRILLADNVTYSGPTTLIDKKEDLPIPHLEDTPCTDPKPTKKTGFVKKWDKISEETRKKMSDAQKASYAKRKAAKKAKPLEKWGTAIKKTPPSKSRKR